jgi:hypothetical protein
MTKQRATWRLASGGQRWPKEIGSVGWMRGWVELLTGPAKKNMVESMRWDRKIGEGMLADQNGKENGNKNSEGFFGYWKLEI